MYLLIENVPTDRNMPIKWKYVYWLKRCPLKMKSYKCSVFLHVYVALIYVAMWCNKVRSRKSQTFWFYIILVANPCDALE